MRRYAFYMMVLGVGGGLFFWSCLGCIEMVNDAFAAGSFMGWSTLACLSLLVGGFFYLSFSEFLGYISLRKVDSLARALQSDNVERARSLAIRWMHSLSRYDTVELQNAQSVQEIQHFVASQVADIDAKVDCIIAKESVLIAAFVGVSPWATLDGVLAAWRQLRLMRSIASKYGVRPSTIGTIRLLRRVLISVVLADVSQHVTQWIASKVPSLGGLIPAAGQSLALLVLTARVGKACQKACRPMKPCQKRAIATVYEKLRAFFTINKKNPREGEAFLVVVQAPTHL